MRFQIAIALAALVPASAFLVASRDSAGADGASCADDAELFRDPFTRQLAEGWSLVRQQPGAVRVGEGAIEIRSLPGVIAEAKNLLLRDAPAAAGPLAFEVTVSNEPTQQWEQLGLVYYWDDAHHVKLVKERVDEKLWVVMGKAHPSAGGLVAKLPLEGAKVSLRLVVADGHVTGLWRAKADDPWTKAGECPLPGEGPGKLGLVTFHGPQEVEHWARFEGFRVLRVRQ